jgi:DNA-binding transcriptional LysR family regulator
VISRRIRDLEDTIGVSIFERFSGGIRLTDAGAEFVGAIRRALDDIDAAISTAGTAGLGGSGRLKIGFCGSLSTGELRATLIDYLGRYPDVAVDVTEGCGPQLTTELKRQAIDIAILADESPRDEDTMALWSERVMVAVPDSHCLAARSQVHWYDLMGERILLSRRDDGPEIHSLLIACLSAPGERPVIESHKISRENVLSMVGAGRGVALLHQGGTGITYPGVVYREVHGADGPVEVANVACWVPTNDNPALRRFLSLLKAPVARLQSSASSVAAGQQANVATSHQVESGAHQANGPGAQVMGLPMRCRRHPRLAEQALRDRPIALVRQPCVERPKRERQALTSLWGQPLGLRVAKAAQALP